MKKEYSEPQIETAFMAPMNALCTSGEENSNLNGNGNGENPWDYGRAPKF